MKDFLDYDIDEEIIKDGKIMADLKNSHFWPVLKELIESEIRACFRAFLSNTEMKMNSKGDMVETPLDDSDLKNYRSRAIAAKDILEMIDGKIADMEVWIAQQQKNSEKDVDKVQEIFNHHRSRMQAEVL